MSVKIVINENTIQAKIDDAWESGLEMLSSQILKDCNLYCKFDEGYLIMSSYIHSNLKKGLLVWNTPYAARQYYEIKTSYASGRVWRWAEYAKTRHLADWNRQAQAITRYYK